MPATADFTIVEHAEEYAEVHALRALRYEPRFPKSSHWWLDHQRDFAGKVFLMRGGGRALATLRLLQATACMTEMEELGLLPEELKGDPYTWELGRLSAIANPQRQGSYGRQLFGWATSWAQANLEIKRVVSYCKEGRVPSFRILGADVVAGPYDVPGRGVNYYTIIAEVETVAERLRLSGTRA